MRRDEVKIFTQIKAIPVILFPAAALEGSDLTRHTVERPITTITWLKHLTDYNSIF